MLLAERGIVVHGIDISHRFVELARADAPAGATFERVDARSMSFDAEFDAVICLCQGAFGLMTADGHDATVLAGMARALEPGGRLALTAFSAYFVDQALGRRRVRRRDGRQPRAHRDPQRGRRGGHGRSVDRLLHAARVAVAVRAHGLRVDAVSSVEPGAYSLAPPTADSPEFLLLATRIH